MHDVLGLETTKVNKEAFSWLYRAVSNDHFAFTEKIAIHHENRGKWKLLISALKPLPLG